MAPLIDIAAFCAFMSAGLSLRAGNTYAFVIGFALTWLLNWRVAGAAPLWRSALAGLMALFLRAGILALLAQRWGWAPQIAILFAVPLGLAVTAPRWRNPAFALIAYSLILRLV